jgi:hypothetical protein
MAKYKQDAETIRKTIIELFASYRPNRELADTLANGQLIWSYMERHFQKDGLVDGTYQNFRASVAALEPQLEWAKKPTKAIERPKHVSDLDAKLATGIRDARNALTYAQNEADLESLRKAAYIVSTFADNTHAKTARGKEALAKVFDAEQAKLEAEKQTAAGLLAAVKATKDKL